MPLHLLESPSRRRRAPIDFPLDQELRRPAQSHWPAHRLANAPKDGRRVVPFDLGVSRAGKVKNAQPGDTPANHSVAGRKGEYAANFPLFEFP
jgi:hypothetical protein